MGPGQCLSLCSPVEAALAVALKAQSWQGPSLQQQALHADEAAAGAGGAVGLYIPLLLLGQESKTRQGLQQTKEILPFHLPTPALSHNCLSAFAKITMPPTSRTMAPVCSSSLKSETRPTRGSRTCIQTGVGVGGGEVGKLGGCPFPNLGSGRLRNPPE